jgi:hypothetical protein
MHGVIVGKKKKGKNNIGNAATKGISLRTGIYPTNWNRWTILKHID